MSQRWKGWGRLVWALLAFNLVVHLVVALRPLAYIDGLIIPDDAYLALNLSRNIARGLGPYLSLNLTNGFQPLYVFLMVPVYALIPHDLVLPVRIAVVILVLFDTASLFLIARLLRRLGAGWPAVAAAMLFWTINPYVIRSALNGLETIISVFCVLLLFTYYQARDGLRDAPARRGLALGALLGLAALARIDNLVLVPVLAVVFCGRALRGESIRRLLITSAAIAAGALLAYGPWLAYSYAYTGALYPISGNATRFLALYNVHQQPTWNWYWGMMGQSLYVIRRNNWFLYLPAACALGAALLAARSFRPLRRLRRLELLFLYGLFLWAAYAGYLFTSWYYPRYLFPLTPILVLALGLCLDEALRRIPRTAFRAALALGLAAVLGVVIARTDFGAFFLSSSTKRFGYMNVGLWANRTFAPGTVVGASQSGALGYFADRLTVVNLDGVVNAGVYQAITHKRLLDYMADAEVEYVVGWGVNIMFIGTYSARARRARLREIGAIPGFRSWDIEWLLYRVEPQSRPPSP